MCGIAGAIDFDGNNTVIITKHMLEALQHRGQESAGIAWTKGTEVTGFKNFGLVHEVLSKEALAGIKSPISIAHTRYSTTGKSENINNIQPIIAFHKLSAIVHNGNLINSKELKNNLTEIGVLLYGTSDTELIAAQIHYLGNNIIERIKEAISEKLVGAYSVIVITRTKLIAFRDPYGIRPLSLGKVGNTWVVASETCAFDNVGAEFIRDVQPGEMIIFNLRDKTIKEFVIKQNDKCHLCVFEVIYFARPDSYLKKYQVCQLRQNLGWRLAEESVEIKADIFGAVPNSGTEASIGFAEKLGISRNDLFLSDRYRAVKRTFIEPDQTIRQRSVSKKLHPYHSKIFGKRVAYIDDSIVRGNNTAEINRILLEVGAKSIDVYIASPRIEHPCPYGIDTASKSELIAAKYTNLEIAKIINARSVKYLSIRGLYEAIPFRDEICDACFTGNYPIPVDENNLSKEILEKTFQGGKKHCSKS